MNAFDLLDALEFEDQFVFYQNVNPVRTITSPAVDTGAEMEFRSAAVHEPSIVRRWIPAGAAPIRDDDGTANDAIREIVEFHPSCSSCPSWSVSTVTNLVERRTSRITGTEEQSMNSGPTSSRSPVHPFVRGDRWRAGRATTPGGSTTA